MRKRTTINCPTFNVIVILLIIILGTVHYVFGQNTFSSTNGWSLKPRGTYRLLTIFVNIHYDITPERNPIKGTNPIWTDGTINSLNGNTPEYFVHFLDTSTKVEHSPKATMSRLYYESSFG